MSLGTNSVTITIDESPKVLVRINQDNFGSQYYLRESAQEFTLNVRHSKESPNAKTGIQYDRHNVELVHTVFQTETTPARSRVVYLVARNTRDDDYAAIGEDMVGFVDFFDGPTIANLLAWVN